MRPNEAEHYFEAHVTIEPVFDEKLELASELAKNSKFKIASLLMQKREADTPTRSMYDTFMTGHSKDLQDIQSRIKTLVEALRANGYVVWRYKIEDTVMDSRINDTLGILNG